LSFSQLRWEFGVAHVTCSRNPFFFYEPLLDNFEQTSISRPDLFFLFILIQKLIKYFSIRIIKGFFFIPYLCFHFGLEMIAVLVCT